MAKKAVIGTSPKDLSTDKMDRFIMRETRREQQNLRKYGKKDLSKIPFNEWPLQKKLEYVNSQTRVDKFKEQYDSYSIWYDAVKKQSGVYPTTFIDWTAKIRDVMRGLYEKHTPVKDAVYILKKDYGIY